MSVVMCSRCDKFVDLDVNVDDMVVLPDGMNYTCVDCLNEEGADWLEENGEYSLEGYTQK